MASLWFRSIAGRPILTDFKL